MQPPRPMWYPNEKYDRNVLKKYYHYPSKIDTPAKLVWRDNSRIGIMAEINTSNLKNISYKLSYLDTNNILMFLDNNTNSKKKSILTTIGFIVKFRFYKQALALYYSKFNFFRRVLIYFKIL